MNSLPVSTGARPIPVPRTRSPAPKKPVPLPRNLTDNDTNDTSKPSESDLLASRFNEQIKDPTRSVSRVIKQEFKSATETVQERGKAVIEGTRNASARLEKSVRSMIDKRRTGYQISPVQDKELTITRSNSLPAQDIFQSISFHSPLSDDQLSEIKSPPSISEMDSSDEERETVNAAPPPVYPPPPLPDESVYDELQSVISSHSSNYDPYYCSSVSGSNNDSESVYEDISMVRGQTNHSPSSQSSLSRAELERCESWSFYDAAAKEAEEISLVLPAGEENQDVNKVLSKMYSEDPASVAFSRTISCSSDSPTAFEEFDREGAHNASCDDDPFSLDCSHNRLSSISVENDLYHQWDPQKHFLPAPLRNKTGESRGHPSQSVMIEFDPLYENNSCPKKLMSKDQSENMFLAQSLSPYGKINKIGKLKELVLEELDNEEEDVQLGPVVPPRSYHSSDLNLSLETASLPGIVRPSIVEPKQKLQNLTPPGTSRKPKPANHNEERTLLQKMPSDSTLNVLELPPKTPWKRSQETPPPPKEIQAKPKRALPLPPQNTVNTRPRQSLFQTPIPKTEESRTVPDPQQVRSSSVPKEDAPAKSHTSLVRWSSMKKALRQVTDGSLRFSARLEAVSLPKIERPGITSQMAMHSGLLYRAAVGEWGKDFSQRYCVLGEGRLTCYTDKSRTDIKDVIALNSILSIQLILDHKTSTDGEDLHCLELNLSWKGRSYVFGSTGSTERRVWMQKILESLTVDFPMRISSDYYRSGWCYMKEGISGAWGPAWILLSKRTFFYKLQAHSVQEIDLRKARCVELQDCGPNSPKVEDNSQVILLDYPGQSVYLKMDLAKETVTWRNVIKAASVDNGSNLAQQQLTKDDVPAIVDKCINFVYAHGSLSEGIYRRSGANSSVAKLLAQFRHDAWSVQLARQEYNEFDVASVLKRFFRDLPESLLTTELHSELCEISAGTGASDKLNYYHKALEKLPPINYLTLRRLLGHLYFIQEQQEKTLMPIENLASIWGPTLMHIEGADSLGTSRVQSAVVADLILFYPSLFDVDADELRREKQMQDALERLHATGNNNLVPKNRSGDLKVWIHLGVRDSKNCVNVSIGPQKLAGEVCAELCARLSTPAHELCLEEVVLGGSLTRPLHHMEQVLGTILRWGYWEEADRRDNCLVLRKNVVVAEIASLAKQPASASGELRYADQRSKSFKSYLFEFSQAKLCYYKDKNCATKIGEWKIEDIVWYIGHEPKRNPQTRWSITFIDKNNTKTRSKENPFFGHTIAGTSSEEMTRWMTAMLIGEHQQDLMIQPVLLH